MGRYIHVVSDGTLVKYVHFSSLTPLTTFINYEPRLLRFGHFKRGAAMQSKFTVMLYYGITKRYLK